MAEDIISVVGKGKIEYTPWPEEYRLVETGDSEMDISKLTKVSGFAPKVGLEEGIKKTFEYYSKYKENYI
jgi:nucleoside-diphosphate-sugar epimerase